MLISLHLSLVLKYRFIFWVLDIIVTELRKIDKSIQKYTKEENRMIAHKPGSLGQEGNPTSFSRAAFSIKLDLGLRKNMIFFINKL